MNVFSLVDHPGSLYRDSALALGVSLCSAVLCGTSCSMERSSSPRESNGRERAKMQTHLCCIRSCLSGLAVFTGHR